MFKKLSTATVIFLLLLAVLGWRPTLNPFNWIFSGQGNTSTTSLPPKVDLQKLAELVTLRINTERIVHGEDNFYKGIYFVPGNAYLGIDLKQANIQHDLAAKRIVITLPQPHPVVSRVDLRKVKQYDLSLKRLGRAFDKAFNQFIEIIDEISPRNFRHGVPMYWIIRSLTYEDATTTGQLSVEPDLAFGCAPQDMRRFTAPL